MFFAAESQYVANCFAKKHTTANLYFFFFSRKFYPKNSHRMRNNIIS